MSILYQSKLGGNKVRKLLTLYFNCNVVWLIIFSVFWSLLSLTIFSVYINDYRKVMRRTCWFEYSETDQSKPVKYYIYYAPDHEYVVCGRMDKYEENNEYRYFKISELKDTYVIHFEKRMDIYQR